LRTLRLTRGFTQPALAEKADIEQSYLSKLENGRSKPSEDVLARLASALETTPEALANGDEADPGRNKLWYALIAITGVVLLAAMFFIGRITSMYAISPQQVVAGSHSQADMTQQIMNLAPKGVLVGRISHMDPGLGNRIFVTGTAPDRAAVDVYMTAVRQRFGGEFSGVEMGQLPGNPLLIQFEIDFDPQGIKPLPTTAASDRSASKH
ncbi:MAG: helix-turn-helix domain-containing protein, partial [Gammaproteobacteria bacterium]